MDVIKEQEEGVEGERRWQPSNILYFVFVFVFLYFCSVEVDVMKEQEEGVEGERRWRPSNILRPRHTLIHLQRRKHIVFTKYIILFCKNLSFRKWQWQWSEHKSKRLIAPIFVQVYEC